MASSTVALKAIQIAQILSSLPERIEVQGITKQEVAIKQEPIVKQELTIEHVPMIKQESTA